MHDLNHYLAHGCTLTIQAIWYTFDMKRKPDGYCVDLIFFKHLIASYTSKEPLSYEVAVAEIERQLQTNCYMLMPEWE